MTGRAAAEVHGRVSLSSPIRRETDLKPGDSVFFRHLGKTQIEVRRFPKMTWGDVIEIYGGNDPVADLEEMAREEELHLADTFR